jgi:pantoate--beta-alanine ligase
LALSSRNAYLSADNRQRAVILPRALQAAASTIRGGGNADDALRAATEALIEGGFSNVDYVALVDAETLEPVARAGHSRLIAAATIGGTRLIDNLAV